MAYPFKNNLNISYQEAMANDARNKAMGDYDAINVDSEELIDYTPSFQEQYNADMAKVASNNQRIKELEAIIAQKKQNEINFSKYRNNPLYKAAKFDYVVNGNRSGLDQFLADERAREEMIRQTREAELNRQNAIKLANMQKAAAAAANANSVDERLAQAKLAMDQAYRMYMKDQGNQNLLDVFEKAQLTYNQLASKAGQEPVDYLKKPETPAGEGKPSKSKADTAKDISSEITQAITNGDIKKLEEINELLKGEDYSDTVFNHARDTVTKGIKDYNDKAAAAAAAAEAKAKADADRKALQDERTSILNGTYGYSDGQDKIKRLNQIAKKLKLEETYELDGNKIVVRNK